MSSNPMIARAESLVKEHMAKYDPSHDWWHVNRVRNTALKLSQSQAGPVDPVVLELLALFHDLHDAKYAAAGGPTLEQTLQPFFDHPDVSVSSPQQAMILKLIPLISWSTEKKLRASGQWESYERDLKKTGGWTELCCAQDADRLDAVGGFGVSCERASAGGPFERKTLCRLCDAQLTRRLSVEHYMFHRPLRRQFHKRSLTQQPSDTFTTNCFTSGIE